MIGSYLHRIGNWISTHLSPKYKIVVVNENLPEPMLRRVLYIVQEDGYVEQAAMVCPCGCQQVLHMNMLPDERPCWTLKTNSDETQSLHPSVWRKKGCGSHFWFKNNRIQWCRGKGPWWNRL